MAYPKVYVDGILLNWADRLFFPPPKRSKGSPGISPALLYLALQTARAGRVRAQIDRTVRKVPEVVVKVTNKKGAGRSMTAIRQHLEYISRNAKIEIEDQEQEIYLGQGDLRQIKSTWQVSGRRRIPDEAEDGRGLHAVNLMFSMSPGTPTEAVKDAVRELLAEEFRGREYLFVLHTDRLHPHVHVCLKTVATRELPRLRHGKQELQRWRERFAEKIRDRGIEANATPKRTRGQTRSPVPLHVHHRDKRNPPSPALPAPIKPRAFQAQREAWRAMAQALNQSTRPDDISLARRIVQFWRSTPAGAAAPEHPTPSHTVESKKYGYPERFKRARLAVARLGYASLFKSDFGHPGHRSQIEPISRLREVPSGDLVQNHESRNLLLPENARNHLYPERKGKSRS